MAIDANACLAAGKCLVITNTQYTIFISIFVLAGILLTILMMVGFMTPAIIFLKAKIKKASLIYSVNRGQQGQFLIASSKFQGIADVKKVGPFIITENSHTIEKKSKTSLYFAFGEFAATLPLSYAMIVQNLRQQGKKIANIDDLADLSAMKFDEKEKVWTSQKEKDATMENFNEEIKPYKTIKLHEMAFMFPFNITPALVESKIQHMIGLKQALFNKMTPQMILMFIMLLMGVSLAAMIISKFVGAPDPTGGTVERTIIERVVQVGGVANLTG